METIYKNQKIDCKNLSYYQRANKILAKLKVAYPELIEEDAVVVTDLMARYNQDVFEEDGKFLVKSIEAEILRKLDELLEKIRKKLEKLK